tara:strand:- start:743 stop:1045 length:303 start_codon:yes stop_codon:yes gene_type:complete
MILFWLTYFLISLSIAFLVANFFKGIFLKSLVFSFLLAILSTIWFKSPGENIFAPALSILLLESSIIENNGIVRILRPVSFLTFFYFLISYFALKVYSKN